MWAYRIVGSVELSNFYQFFTNQKHKFLQKEVKEENRKDFN